MLVIGIIGYDNYGKDTFAKYLEEELIKTYSSKVEILHFADSLKKFVTNLLDIDLDTLERLKKDVNYKSITISVANNDRKYYTVRDLLVKIGRSVAGSLGPTVFVESLKNTIVKSNSDIFIIPDVRFLTEAYMIKNKLNGLILKVESDIEGCNNIGYTYEIPQIENRNMIDFGVFFKNIEESKSSASEIVRLITPKLMEK